MFKVNCKDSGITSFVLAWCLYCELGIRFTPFSGVAIVDVEKVKCSKEHFIICNLGRHLVAQYVQYFKLKYSLNGYSCKYYQYNGSDKVSFSFQTQFPKVVFRKMFTEEFSRKYMWKCPFP